MKRSLEELVAILRLIKRTAWADAKRHLKATLNATLGAEGNSDEYNRIKRLTEKFISDVEDYED